jgi:hypothetical protein
MNVRILHAMGVVVICSDEFARHFDQLSNTFELVDHKDKLIKIVWLCERWHATECRPQVHAAQGEASLEFKQGTTSAALHPQADGWFEAKLEDGTQKVNAHWSLSLNLLFIRSEQGRC